MFTFKQPAQTPFQALQDKVAVALETGNPAAARLALAADESLTDEERAVVVKNALNEYGVDLT